MAERQVTLLDGTPGIVRPVVPSDRDALAKALADLEPESRVRRFFYDKARLTDAELTQLTHPDGVTHIAYGLAVEIEDQPHPLPVAVGRCLRDPERDDLAEVAVVTADLWQNIGAGAEVMRSLASAALTVGIRRWFAAMLADNTAARRLLGRFGEPCDERPRGGGIVEVTYRIELPPDDPVDPLARIRI